MSMVRCFLCEKEFDLDNNYEKSKLLMVGSKTLICKKCLTEKLGLEVVSTKQQFDY